MVDSIVLTGEERAEVDRLVDDVLAHLDLWDPLRFVDQSATWAQDLPPRLRRFLAHVRADETDIAVVSGLPVADHLAATPAGWDVAAKTGAGSREELVLVLCGSALGEPFGWSNQQDGRVVHDVLPAPGMEQSLTSASSAAELSLHTEDVFHPCRGDYVSLFCLRNPDAVGTTYVRVDALSFPDDVRDTLAADAFRFYPDDSHVAVVLNALDSDDLPPPSRPSHTGSVLFGPMDRPYLRFDKDFMAAQHGDPAVTGAIQEVQRRLGGAVERVVLSPGDAVFIDNYQVVHGREPFDARYDGTDRWLKRLNLIRDVRRIYATAATRSRIIVA
jgi:Fe(II)/alpha-ketoglutarate-dependent arginine beta-hydroxylase